MNKMTINSEMFQTRNNDVKKTKKVKQLFSSCIIMSSLIFPTLTSAEESFYSWLIDFSRTKGVAQTNNALYEDECGACHFPYQPGLMIEQSWKNLLDPKQLADHFGENAELDEDILTKLLMYTTSNSAEKSWYKRPRQIVASLDKKQYPSRITETPYIKNKHKDIPEKQIIGNEKVKSLSYCDNCHKLAKKGIFDDDTVVIP